MTITKIKNSVVVFILSLLVACGDSEQAPKPPHQIYFNGQILTMDAEKPRVEAISVRDGIIESVGNESEVMLLVEGHSELIDLKGATLMPGFVDAHGHFPGSGRTAFSADLNSPPIGTISSIEELLTTLAAFGEQRPEGWLVGHGYDDTLLAEMRHPTRDDLDRISADRPIAISHVSGHLAVANSAALELMGIDQSTPDPKGGHIVRDPNSPDQRRPNGVLEETAAREVSLKTLNIDATDAMRMTQLATNEYLKYGVTTASAGGMPMGLGQMVGAVSSAGTMPLRVAFFPLMEEIGDDLLSGESRLSDFEMARVEVPRVKIIADGSIQGYTGYLTEPYHRPYKGDASYRGYPSVLRDDLFAQVAGLYEKRIQVAIHGNGDASIDDSLDAIAAAAEQHPWPDARPLIIHAQMTRRDQLDRMKELNVTPSFFSAHTYFWGDRHVGIFMGPERAANMSPAKWAIDAGVRFSSHMDTPITPMRPLQAVWSQVERLSKSGALIGPDQRIDRDAALRAVTIDAAWQVFMDDRIGSLEPGKLADLIVLSGDPLTEPDVRDLMVLRTVIEGEAVYSIE